MTTPKRNKFDAIFQLENALYNLFNVGFTRDEVREIIKTTLREILKKLN
jgi:hypothetical protein